ncbi:MAG: AI-2E family transporter YdiK [Pseudomonadota bacterium]|nr:AI-2E family transporter YdiK [Pseudomonadota bacterium]
MSRPPDRSDPDNLPPPHATPMADLARITFSVLFIGGLIGTSVWILRPFIGPGIWATMVVVATWPLMRRIQRLLWGRRSLAVIAMTLILLLLFVIPLTLVVVTIAANAEQLVSWAKLAATFHLPEQPPAWLVHLPLVGNSVTNLWDQATAMGLRDLLPRLTPYAGDATRWFVGQIGGIGFVIVQFLVTVVIAAVMFASGEEAAGAVRSFARRLGGDRGVGAIELAGGAIRGVALGVGVTAAVQAVMGGIGVAVAGVPFAGLLTALMFMMCLAQLGPAPVLVPAVIWTIWSGHLGVGIALAIWSTIATLIDNVIRPLLIRMGADLSLLLIFAGVIGGIFAFGLVGIFIGPVVLAVGVTLLEAWMGDVHVPPPHLAPPGGEPATSVPKKLPAETDEAA